MLALLVGLLASAGLLARGAWDLWAQSALFLLVAGGTGLWLSARIAIGYVPLPPRPVLAWAGVLAALAALSACGSPVAYYAVQYWRVLLLGLWIFCVATALSKDDRAAIDQGVRAAAWTLMLLAFYQRWHDHLDRPPSALLNQNVFAGAILMLLPLAVQQRDWLLSGGLLLCLWWTKSVGAWIGLSAALILTRRGRDAVGGYLGMGILFVCLVAVYAKLQSPEVLHRWAWWSAAWRMAAARPVFGFGPGSFAYAAPSFMPPRAELSTLYAHQHFLETAAEAGWPYLLVWVFGLAQLLRRGGAPHKRFGALAILVQSLWDYPLSVPGVFWLFCYFAASMMPQSSQGLNVRSSRKPAWIGVVLAAAAAGCWWSARAWRADRLKAQALEAFRDGAPPPVVAPMLERSLSLEEDPEAERALAELLLPVDPRQAAVHLLRAAKANPYRPSTWAALERLHDSLGDPDGARRLRAEGESYCPILRPEAR